MMLGIATNYIHCATNEKHYVTNAGRIETDDLSSVANAESVAMISMVVVMKKGVP